jgi:hypothetical protein
MSYIFISFVLGLFFYGIAFVIISLIDIVISLFMKEKKYLVKAMLLRISIFLTTFLIVLLFWEISKIQYDKMLLMLEKISSKSDFGFFFIISQISLIVIYNLSNYVNYKLRNKLTSVINMLILFIQAESLSLIGIYTAVLIAEC